MTVGDRFKKWIERLSESWKDRLSGWIVNFLATGAKRALKSTAPSQDTITKLLNRYKSRAGTSVDLTEAIEWLRSMEDTPIGWFFGLIIMAIQTLGVVFRGSAPLGNEIQYAQDRVIRSQILDPMQAITAWRREALGVEHPLDDLKSAGLSDDRIETLKFLSEIIPGVSDLIRMSVKEAFSPEVAEKFGQYQDPPTAVYPWAEKLGLSKDWVDRYWAAHWDLPGASQGFEMFQRTTTEPTKFSGGSIGISGGKPFYKVISEENLKLLLRALDVMPAWREPLTRIAYLPYTRVDARRMRDMEVLDNEELKRSFLDIGYDEEHATKMRDWTLVYNAFPDLLARYKNGWITIENVKRELIAMGMTKERADTLIEEKIKKAAPERVAAERDLTAAEIIKGVKKEVITWDEGLELLMDMGYDKEEAEFKLAIEVAAMTGSPESYPDFKDLTQKYRLAAGMEGKPMTEEIKKLGAEVVRLSAEVAALEKSVKAEQGKLVPDTVLPVEATARVKELQATLYKVQAELIRVQTDYNAKVTEWKHAAK